MHRTRLVLRLSYALALVACGLLALRAFRGQSVPDQLAPDDGQHASPYPPLPDFGELALFKPASADQAGGGHALQAPSCDVCPPTDAICRSLGCVSPPLLSASRRELAPVVGWRPSSSSRTPAPFFLAPGR